MAQCTSQQGLLKGNGDFKIGSTSSDLPAIHRGEFARWMVHARLLRMDGFRPKPSFATALEFAYVVGDCFLGFLLGSTVAAHRAKETRRFAADTDAVLGSCLVASHRWCRNRDTDAREVSNRVERDRLHRGVCVSGCVRCTAS